MRNKAGTARRQFLKWTSTFHLYILWICKMSLKLYNGGFFPHTKHNFKNTFNTLNVYPCTMRKLFNTTFSSVATLMKSVLMIFLEGGG